MPLVINGEKVEPALLDQEFSAIKSHYERMASVSCCERDDEFMGYAKDNITARVLLSQEAARHAPEVTSAEIDDAISQLKEEHGGEEQFYANVGLQHDQEHLLRHDIENSIRVDKVLVEACGPDPEPTQDDLKSYYENNLDAFKSVEEVQATHLFKSLNKSEERQQIFEALREIRRQAMEGADFSALAKEHTDKEEGDVELGYFKMGEFSDDFDTIIFSLNEGEVSPIFSSHWGFHLAKVTGRKPSVPRPMDEVEDEIRERLLLESRQERTKVFVDKLKEKATIEDTPEVEDED